jgi:K+-sensing histidine kinase KdpD
MQTADAAPSKLPALARYGLAIALVAMALLLSLVLRVPFGNPFWFFFSVAVIATTWFVGRGPGWVAVGLSTLAVLYYFIPPINSFAVKPPDIPFFLTFVACELVASLIISWQRQTEDFLRRARDELEARVIERTSELKNANDALLKQMEEQRRTEEALQRARSELARVVRITTIGELRASIAHEVNQPLAAIVANGDACVAWLSLQSPNLLEARAAAERTILGATRASEVISRIRSLINKAAPGEGAGSIE